MDALSKVKNRLFGAEVEQSPDVVSDSSESEGENQSISDGLKRYFAAGETAPEYDTPIILSGEASLIARLFGLAEIMEYERYEFPPMGKDRHIHLSFEASPHTGDSEALRVLTVEVMIEDIEYWASQSRWEEADGEPHERLGLVGKYFVELTSELSTCYRNGCDIPRSMPLAFERVSYDSTSGRATYRATKNVTAYDILWESADV